MKFKAIPITDHLTNRELGIGLNQVHACLEEHKAQTLKQFNRADEWRLSTTESTDDWRRDTAKQITGLSVTVTRLAETISGYQAVVTHVRSYFVRGVGAIIIAVVGAVAAAMVQNYNITKGVAVKAEAARQVAAESTDTTAQYRAQQDAINQAILDRLDKLKSQGRR
jgi:hypothetical protein